jgi:phosphatidylglycerophosphate synthase
MKIKYSQENPIDVFNIWLFDLMSPLFKRLKFNPNHITTLSLIFGVLAIYYLYHHNIGGFAITYYISYFFDCADGYYARKYGMVTKFGDYYDHAKDVAVFIGLIMVLVMKYRAPFKVWAICISILLVALCLTGVQFGCQEKIYDSEETPSLSFSKHLCIGDPEETIKYSKWFGVGMFIFIFIYCIFYLSINEYRSSESSMSKI